MNINIGSCFKYTLIFLRYVFILTHHIYCYSSCILYALLLWPLKWVQPAYFWTTFNPICDLLVTMGTWFTWSAGYGIVEVGDDVTPCYNERTLVVINHQTPCDIVILFNVFRSRTHHEYMWVMNEEFKYTPFGILGSIRKDFFIPIGQEKRAQGLISFKNHLNKWFLRSEKKMLVLFPEGGFLYKRRSKSQKYALEHNLPVLQHVCLPRLGAVQTVVDICTTNTAADGMRNGANAAADQLQWILDVTIAYPKGIPLDLSTIGDASRQPFNTVVVYRLFPANQVGSDPNHVAEWLYSRWQEKEKILSEFYVTGNIPVEEYCSNPISPRLVEQNPFQHVLINIFFVSSFYCFYRLFCLIITPTILNVLISFTLYIVFVALKVTKVV